MAIEIKFEGVKLSREERAEVAEILGRRANEIASFAGKYTSSPDHFGSVEMALTREMRRLRALQSKIEPTRLPEDSE